MSNLALDKHIDALLDALGMERCELTQHNTDKSLRLSIMMGGLLHEVAARRKSNYLDCATTINITWNGAIAEHLQLEGVVPKNGTQVKVQLTWKERC